MLTSVAPVYPEMSVLPYFDRICHGLRWDGKARKDDL
jgi:hypothetical protein